ncbi:MAG: hypothetical protein Ta2B_18540 [Termitinemataceae bacterium]|nr:MAG: hypothetical protein Ta2B_18540 [Termitinemataceae bacterium]
MEKSGEAAKEVVPLDDYLKISDLKFKATKNMVDKISFWAQNQRSYRAAQDTLRREEIGINISFEQIRNIAMYCGELINNHDQKQSDNIDENLEKIPETPSKEGVLYAMADGSMLHTMLEFETKFDWHEVKIGMFFTDNDLKLGSDGEKHIIPKKEFSVCTKDITEFKKLFLEAAIRNGYGNYEKMVIIADGAAWIKKMKEDFFPDAIQILDFFHLAENIYNAAKFIFHDDESKYVKFAETIIDLIRNSRTQEALDLLSEYKDMQFGNGVLNPYTYVLNHLENIDYAAYRKAGYLIGSGPIESANKVVVQRRCKQAGMHWKSENAQRMLNLTSKWESGLWETLVPQLLAAA